MATIQFSHISKVYLSGTEAVKNFSMQVEDGEFIVIVGSSGCGKSTVLRLVAGLEEVTTGELSIDGQIVNEWEPKKRNVAMVFQNYALFPNMTVGANMEFALKMQRVPKKERVERVKKMAELLGIEDLLTRKAKKLSGGQCQRISIGRALVCEPNVFLLDEPLSNLDAAMRMELRAEIAKLQRRLKITTLYVTHDQTEAMTLGTRIVVMDKGEIKQVGTPQNIYCKPQNVFVARFIGALPMNIFHARCVGVGRDIMLEMGRKRIALPSWKSKEIKERGYENKPVLAGIRVEDLYPHGEGSSLPAVELIPLDAVVESVDVLGAETKLTLRAEGEELIAMVRTNARIICGDPITLHMAVDQLHIFDAETFAAIVH